MQRYKINMNIRARIKNNYSYSAKTNFFCPGKNYEEDCLPAASGYLERPLSFS